MNFIQRQGFDQNAVEDLGKYYLVEKDVLFPKDPTRYDFSLGKHYEHGSLLADTRVIVRSGNELPEVWKGALEDAMGHWNSITNSRLTFELGAEEHLLIQSDGGLLPWDVMAAAVFPCTAAPGPIIYVNTDFKPCGGVTADRAEYSMAHQLGHCLGFTHASWLGHGEAVREEEGNVIGNAMNRRAADPQSIMARRGHCTTWSGFSGSDINALETAYPRSTAD
ncbi:MAG: M57 family metalloprotease [Bacteroidota bacterium]